MVNGMRIPLQVALGMLKLFPPRTLAQVSALIMRVRGIPIGNAISETARPPAGRTA
jgi:hypothetical protein